MKIVLLGFCLIQLLCACATPTRSTTKVPTPPQEKTPLLAQPAPLSPEEEERQQALERYREMRARTWDNYIKKKKPAPKRKVITPAKITAPEKDLGKEIEKEIEEVNEDLEPEIEPEITPSPLPTAIPTVAATPTVTPTATVSPERVDPEVEIMADQKMRFHCSAHTTASEAERFDQCLTKAREIWKDCKKEAVSPRKALICLKQSL